MRTYRPGDRSRARGSPSRGRRRRRRERRRTVRSRRVASGLPGSARDARSRDPNTSAGRPPGSRGHAVAARPATLPAPPGTTFGVPSPEPYTIAAMRRWSDLAERVAATTRTSEKTALLADYFRSLTPDELPVAAVFLTGRPFPEADQRTTGLGWWSMMGAISALTGATREDLGQAYDRYSDLSLAVEDVLVRAGHAPPPEVSPTLPEVAAAFAAIESTSGPAAKAKLLQDLLARADPPTAKAIVKVLGGELRIGLREGLVEA